MEAMSKLAHYAMNSRLLGSAVAFIAWAVRQRALRQPRTCPYCGSSRTVALGRRAFVLTLMRCEECLLKFRYPKQMDGWSEWFYQRTDTSGDELPDVQVVRNLTNQRFAGTKYDVGRLIVLLTTFNRGRLLDYGCSWGYGVWQFRDAGYDAVGFELSKPKATFGVTELGVEIIADYAKLESLSSSSFDFVVASHVLEHLSQIDSTLRLFSRLLRRGGKLVVLAPNAGGRLAQEWRGVWPYMISREHNLALDAAWFQRNIGRHGFTPLFSSTKFGMAFSSAVAPYEKDEPTFLQLPDEELLMVATRKYDEVEDERSGTQNV